MDSREKIEEAHGLWELAAAQLIAMVEIGANSKFLKLALKAEREAFKHWKDVSRNELLRPHGCT